MTGINQKKIQDRLNELKAYYFYKPTDNSSFTRYSDLFMYCTIAFPTIRVMITISVLLDTDNKSEKNITIRMLFDQTERYIFNS